MLSPSIQKMEESGSSWRGSIAGDLMNHCDRHQDGKLSLVDGLVQVTLTVLLPAKQDVSIDKARLAASPTHFCVLARFDGSLPREWSRNSYFTPPSRIGDYHEVA